MTVSYFELVQLMYCLHRLGHIFCLFFQLHKDKAKTRRMFGDQIGSYKLQMIIMFMITAKVQRRKDEANRHELEQVSMLG